jgi:hypothetical protein
MQPPNQTTLRPRRLLKIYIVNDSVVTDWLAGATLPIVKWTDVCHQRPFISIQHDEHRYASRHAILENKRPFIVRLHGRGGWNLHKTSSRTLAGAEKLARGLKKSWGRV